jgi:proline dehydrogenase
MMFRQGFLFLSQSDGAKRLLTGTPITRTLSRRFVPGEGVEDLVRAAREARDEGLRITANYLGEAVRAEADARRAASAYRRLITRLGEEALPAGVSLKFTQMGQDISRAFLSDNLTPVLETAREAGVFVRFDMESSAYTQQTLDAFEELWAEGWRDIGVVLQAYLRRTAGDVRRMIELGAPVRLCKGAYAESPSVAYTDPARVRENFVECMRWLLSDGRHAAIATHDEAVIRATLRHADREGISPDRFEFQMLFGVRRDLQKALVRKGFGVWVYIPFGEQWYPYLMRRLAERPENVLFMAGSVVKESPLGFLWPEPRRRRGA